VGYVTDDGPIRFYHYDRRARRASFLYSNSSALEEFQFARMTPVTIRARDGLPLVCYTTLPPAGRAPHPLVLLVHGGPWARDEWGFSPWHQWLADRGYAVLSVNYRGSTGFGKRFLNAGNREWGGAMQLDLLDAVAWTVAQGIADARRIAIMGTSYGGYAALMGLALAPDSFACGIDLMGPSNLVSLLQSIPPQWQAQLDLFTTRVGDHRTEEGRTLLLERSPATYADRIRRPLLIAQGGQDPRVPRAESDRIVAALSGRGVPVIYLYFTDEGHGLARPANRLALCAVAEAFLARHLGGRTEPYGGDLAGSSLEVLAGAEHVPGLPAVLAAR
jgi:dipeptidyl aminopeptidase/acylaminoacyl peptidase